MAWRSNTKTLPMTKDDRRIAVNVMGRLRTAIETRDACDFPAAGLLDMSGKCAATKATLASNTPRCAAEVERIAKLLSALLSMWANISRGSPGELHVHVLAWSTDTRRMGVQPCCVVGGTCTCEECVEGWVKRTYFPFYTHCKNRGIGDFATILPMCFPTWVLWCAL